MTPTGAIAHRPAGTSHPRGSPRAPLAPPRRRGRGRSGPPQDGRAVPGLCPSRETAPAPAARLPFPTPPRQSPRLLHRLPGPPPRSAPLRSAASPPALPAASRTPGRPRTPGPHPAALGRIPHPDSPRPRGAGGGPGASQSRYRCRYRRGSLPRGWGWGRGCGSRPAQLRSMARQAQGMAQPRSPRPAGEDAQRSPPRPRGPGRGERPGVAPPRPGSRHGPAAPTRRRSSRGRARDPAPFTAASGLPPPRSASPSFARPLARLQPLLSQILGLAHTFYDAPVTREALAPRQTRPAPSSTAMQSQRHPEQLAQPQAPQKRQRFPVSEPHLSCWRGLGAAAPPLPSHVSLSHRQQPPPLSGLPPHPPCPGNRRTTEAAPRARAAAPARPRSGLKPLLALLERECSGTRVGDKWAAAAAVGGTQLQALQGRQEPGTCPCPPRGHPAPGIPQSARLGVCG